MNSSKSRSGQRRYAVSMYIQPRRDLSLPGLSESCCSESRKPAVFWPGLRNINDKIPSRSFAVSSPLAPAAAWSISREKEVKNHGIYMHILTHHAD